MKLVKGDVALPEDAQLGKNKNFHEAPVSQREEAERVEQLETKFTVKVPELKFGPADVSYFI